ncbi:glycosyltransferase family 4 protein [Candidatus Chloroploca sp. M-50]|uniref:Glycosyltransferase family 4 protein n=1 Tax=Candidatus Chloroploca mongolica TaxID=2528176 RepID=A0ABS4D7V9_9CHLR|nr:glycosyltransferase family 4 protein [Candidatus Chloroploca mongolica]MBP1465505.1 glycosyltransferase family 4 protein [Candidatus Chloroploca mongolica]
MRILIVTTYGFDPAFPSRPEQIQARALLRRGHTVVAHEYHDRRYPGQTPRCAWLDGGIAVHRAPTLGFVAPTSLLRLLVETRPDVIHLHHLRSLLGYQTVLAARRLGIPTVLTVHGLLHDGDLVVDRERPLEAPLRYENLLTTPQRLLRSLARGAYPRRAFRNYFIHAPLLHVDHLVALSHGERDLLSKLGVEAAKISVLPNALDFKLYADLLANTAPAAKTTHPTILFIGQLVPRKGFDLLVRALPTVVQTIPDVRCIMVSHNQAGAAELRRFAEAGGVTAHLDVRGRVSEAEKLRLLREAAVVVAPSRYEGFGIPLIEALLAEAPVITTDVVACNEVISHERTGLLTPYGDVEALAAAIIRLLREPDLGRRLATEGRREALARYGDDLLAANLEHLYEQLSHFRL